jgi:hypothetical protein
MGQEDDGMQIRNSRTDWQYMIESIGLPRQVFSAGMPRQDFQYMTSGTEQPEQILL